MSAFAGQLGPSCPHSERADCSYLLLDWGGSERLCEVVSSPVQTPARCPRRGDGLWISMSLASSWTKEHLSLVLPGAIGLTRAVCCQCLRLPHALTSMPPPLRGPRSPLQSRALGLFTNWALHSSVLALHLCAVISWVTCILSGHINSMTGHHRLQEQITPPHKHLFVLTSHSFSHSLHWLSFSIVCSCSPTHRTSNLLKSGLKEEPGKFGSTKQPTDYCRQYANNMDLGKGLGWNGTLHLVSKAQASNLE